MLVGRIKYKISDTENYKSACSFVWYDTFWEKSVGFMVFRNRVLRTIFRPEKEGITEGWREQHNEDKISDGASSAVHLVCKFMDFGKNVPVQKAVHNDSNTAFRPKLSHTLEGNCSAYSAVKMTLISSKPIILYNNKDNAVHCSTCHAVHRGAK